MDIAWSTALPTSFNDAVKRTRDALVQQGFGVLTEIDMKAPRPSRHRLLRRQARHGARSRTHRHPRARGRTTPRPAVLRNTQ